MYEFFEFSIPLVTIMQDYLEGLPTPENARENYETTTSDHVPILATVPYKSDDEEKEIRILSWNVLESDGASGFASYPKQNFGETSEQEKRRHTRIVDSIAKFTKECDPQFIALQEICIYDDCTLYEKILKGLNNEYKMFRVDGKKENEYYGCLLFYKKDEFSPDIDESTEPGFDPLKGCVAKFKSTSDKNLVIDMVSVHAPYNEYPVFHENEIEKFLLKNKEKNNEETKLSIVVGDFNCTVAPLPKKPNQPQNIVTSVAPPFLQYTKEQGAYSIDGCFYNDGDSIRQAETKRLNPLTGKEYNLQPVDKNSLCPKQRQEVEKLRMVMAVDNFYKIEKIIDGEYTCFEYEAYLRKSFEDIISKDQTIGYNLVLMTDDIKKYSKYKRNNIYIDFKEDNIEYKLFNTFDRFQVDTIKYEELFEDDEKEDFARLNDQEKSKKLNQLLPRLLNITSQRGDTASILVRPARNVNNEEGIALVLPKRIYHCIEAIDGGKSFQLNPIMKFKGEPIRNTGEEYEHALGYWTVAVKNENIDNLVSLLDKIKGNKNKFLEVDIADNRRKPYYKLAFSVYELANCKNVSEDIKTRFNDLLDAILADQNTPERTYNIICDHFTSLAEELINNARRNDDEAALLLGDDQNETLRRIQASFKELDLKLYGKPPMSKKLKAAIYGLIGALVGAVVGAAIGVAVTAFAGGVGGFAGAVAGAFTGFTIASSIATGGVCALGVGWGASVGFFHANQKQVKYQEEKEKDDLTNAVKDAFQTG